MCLRDRDSLPLLYRGKLQGQHQKTKVCHTERVGIGDVCAGDVKTAVSYTHLMKYFRTQGQLIENAMNGTEKAERSAWDILMAGIPGYNGLSEDSQAANATAWNALSEERCV